jgi:hypothetical protein
LSLLDQSDGRTETVVALFTVVVRPKADPETAFAFLRNSGVHSATALRTDAVFGETVKLMRPLIKRG